MKEKIFNIGYSAYLNTKKKRGQNWTSKIFEKLEKHKVLVMCLTIIGICVVMNCLLIYNFIRIIEQSNII